MRYTTETIERKIQGPYSGKRFASMSDDVVNAMLTIEYRFAAGITIRVSEIPARWDRITGAEYLSGKDARELDEQVNNLAFVMQERRELQEELERLNKEQRRLEDQIERLTREERSRSIIAAAMKTMPFRLSFNLPSAA